MEFKLDLSQPHIILMRGIQASGKSTRAIEFVRDNPGYMRVSRDDLRMQLFNKPHDVDEAIISEVETAMVRTALRRGVSVVIDAMHLQQRYVNRWQRLGYPVEIWEVHAPLDVLRERNARRDREVPEEVIERNFKKFTNKDGSLRKVTLNPEQYVTSNFLSYSEFKDHGLPAAFIFDVDGTLAFNDGHRSFYDYSQVYGDSVQDEVANVARALDETHYILVVTGRKAEALEETKRWLKDHFIPYDEIFAREDGDDRPDAIVKYEILRDKIAPHYHVEGVFDDRPSVCEMWRNIGIPTFQVGDPDVRF